MQKEIENKKRKIIFYVLLIVYFIGLGYFLYYEPLYGRQGFFQEWNFKVFIDNIINDSNIIPFKTITYYLHNIFNYKSAYQLSLDTQGLFLNLFGNFICLMPLSILLPLCFDKQKRSKKYIPTILLINIFVELIQLITENGSFDIDDIILNSGGAILAFLLVNPCIINLIENIIIKQENKLNIPQIIIRMTIILVGAITLIIGFYYRKQIELDYVEFISNYDIKIEYQSSECNREIKEYFYEDELYNYYLTCHSKKDTIIYINDESYNIDEIFDNKTEYHIELYKFIDKGLIVDSEEKYEKLEICGIKGSNLMFSYNASEIVYFMYDSTIDKNNQTCTNVFMIPQKDGIAKVDFYVEKEDSNSIKKTYEFVVKNKKVIKSELIEDKK